MPIGLTKETIHMIEVPSVTEDDLRLFHQNHFSNTLPTPATPSLHISNDADEDDDDALGYYHDGVKRTLTDEQVAMFRHSEIQGLLRERRLRREDEDFNSGSTTSKVPSEPSNNTESGKDKPERSRSISITDNGNSSKRKWQRFIDSSETNPEKLTHRRLARELDEQKTKSIDLAYGDEEPSSAPPERPKSTASSSSRRKQVVYGDPDEMDVAKSESKNDKKPSTFAWPILGS